MVALKYIALLALSLPAILAHSSTTGKQTETQVWGPSARREAAALREAGPLVYDPLEARTLIPTDGQFINGILSHVERELSSPTAPKLGKDGVGALADLMEHEVLTRKAALGADGATAATGITNLLKSLEKNPGDAELRAHVATLSGNLLQKFPDVFPDTK